MVYKVNDSYANYWKSKYSNYGLYFTAIHIDALKINEIYIDYYRKYLKEQN